MPAMLTAARPIGVSCCRRKAPEPKQTRPPPTCVRPTGLMHKRLRTFHLEPMGGPEPARPYEINWAETLVRSPLGHCFPEAKKVCRSREDTDSRLCSE